MIPKSKRKIINPVTLAYMNQSVNEAIEKCAEKATDWVGSDNDINFPIQKHREILLSRESRKRASVMHLVRLLVKVSLLKWHIQLDKDYRGKYWD